MFHQYLQPAGPAPRRSATATVVGVSMFVHAAAVTAIVIAGMWRIDKLAVEQQPILAPAPPSRPAPGGGDGKLPPLKKKAKGDDGDRKVSKKAVEDLQPTGEPVVEEDDSAGDSAGDADGDVDGSPFGHELGEHGGAGTGIYVGDGRCPMPICGRDAIPEVDVPDDPPEVEDEIVPAEVLNGHRTRGETKIVPSEAVRTAMVRAGEDHLDAAIKICIDARGRVRDLNVVGSSGYADYDAALLRAMRRWEYTPYTIGGKAVPACTAVHFKFRMR